MRHFDLQANSCVTSANTFLMRFLCITPPPTLGAGARRRGCAADLAHLDRPHRGTPRERRPATRGRDQRHLAPTAGELPQWAARVSLVGSFWNARAFSDWLRTFSMATEMPVLSQTGSAKQPLFETRIFSTPTLINFLGSYLKPLRKRRIGNTDNRSSYSRARFASSLC